MPFKFESLRHIDDSEDNTPFPQKLVMINGTKKTVSEWSQETGISIPTIRYRYKLGLTGEKLISPTTTNIEYDGQTKSLMEWSMETDIPYATLYARYKNGKRNEELFLPFGFKPVKTNEKTILLPKKTIASFIRHNPNAKRIHNIWTGIKARCFYKNNKDYHIYGAKGITLHEEWKNDYFAFYEWAIANGYEDGLTLMRKNRKGNYEPSNCKWATMKEQATTRTNNIHIELNGETKTLYEWTKEVNLSGTTIKRRIESGLTGEELFAATGIQLEYNGETKSISKWSEITGIPYGTLISRFYRGKTGDELLKQPTEKLEKNTLVEIDGAFHPLREWADISGIQYHTIYSRYKNGKRGKDLLSSSRIESEEKISDNIKHPSIAQMMREYPEVKKLYNTWKDIKKRCSSSNKRYAASHFNKGITVWENWNQDFWNFHNWSLQHGFHLDLSLVRLDKNKGYEPANCQWQ